MCRLRNIAMGDYQESVTIGQITGGQTDRQTPDKVIPTCMCRYMLRKRHKNCNKICLLNTNAIGGKKIQHNLDP